MLTAINLGLTYFIFTRNPFHKGITNNSVNSIAINNVCLTEYVQSFIIKIWKNSFLDT